MGWDRRGGNACIIQQNLSLVLANFAEFSDDNDIGNGMYFESSP